MLIEKKDFLTNGVENGFIQRVLATDDGLQKHKIAGSFVGNVV